MQPLLNLTKQPVMMSYFKPETVNWLYQSSMAQNYTLLLT